MADLIRMSVNAELEVGHSCCRCPAVPAPLEDSLAEDNMTDSLRPVCYCPEPCYCYAEGFAHGKDQALFEMEVALQDDTHGPAAVLGPAKQ